MMYNEKLAVAIKSNGKILREFKDKVYIKFGSEYSIFIKNLNSVRALVNVYIDGTNVTSGGLVVSANSEIDLERSLANNNLNVGNKFKFIERTGDIENHRGIKLEDGIVKIEYQFEKLNPITWSTYTTNIWFNYPILRNTCGTGMSYSSTHSNNAVNTSIFTGLSAEVSTPTSTVAQNFYNETGITVPGSKSEQKFVTANWFPVEATTHCMVINLLGQTPDNKPIVKTVTVKHKPRCTSCGSQNKVHAKFCNKCGTALEIFS